MTWWLWPSTLNSRIGSHTEASTFPLVLLPQTLHTPRTM